MANYGEVEVVSNTRHRDLWRCQNPRENFKCRGALAFEILLIEHSDSNLKHCSLNCLSFKVERCPYYKGFSKPGGFRLEK